MIRCTADSGIIVTTDSCLVLMFLKRFGNAPKTFQLETISYIPIASLSSLPLFAIRLNLELLRVVAPPPRPCLRMPVGRSSSTCRSPSGPSTSATSSLAPTLPLPPAAAPARAPPAPNSTGPAGGCSTLKRRSSSTRCAWRSPRPPSPR